MLAHMDTFMLTNNLWTYKIYRFNHIYTSKREVKKESPTYELES